MSVSCGSHDLANVELDLPSLVVAKGTSRNRFDHERADFGDGRLEAHRDDVAVFATFGGQRDLDRRELINTLIFPAFHAIASFVLAPYRRSEKSKMHGFADDQSHRARCDLCGCAFLHSEWGDADRGDFGLDSRNRGRV